MLDVLRLQDGQGSLELRFVRTAIPMFTWAVFNGMAKRHNAKRNCDVYDMLGVSRCARIYGNVLVVPDGGVFDTLPLCGAHKYVRD